MANSFLILAQAAPGSGSSLGTFGFMLLLGAIMYFMMIRPQQKQLKEHRTLVAGLKKGDEVVTQGGILGRIHAVTDREVTLEISNGVRVRVLKTAISGKAPTAAEPAASLVATKVEEKEEK